MKTYLLSAVAFCIFIFSTSNSYGQKDSLWTTDDLGNITVLLSDSVSGSGTIISHNNKTYLLTAEHVAKGMTQKSTITFHLIGDKPASFYLRELIFNEKMNWLFHIEADLAIIELTLPNKDSEEYFKRWSFSSDLIYEGKEAVSRDILTTFLGYPIIDHKIKHFSPLSFSAYPASGLMTDRRADTKNLCSFFFLDQPSMQGASGGGVFCFVRKFPMHSGNKTMLIGVIHGTSGDNTGGKLAMVTPSYYI